MDQQVKNALISLLLFVVGTAAGMLLSRSCMNRGGDGSVVVRTDTLYVRDTVVENNPVYVTNTVTDTMLVAIRDTVTVRDTAYVVIDMEQKYYRGDSYEAWVSGYRPRLDSIYVFPETRYVTREVEVQRKPARWGIGIQAGYGVGLSSGQVRAFPYIGVGISYSIIRF